MSDSGAFAELATLEELALRAPAWRDLVERAAEPNAFAEPAFLAPALRWLRPRRLLILLVWRDARRETLIGLMALEPPRLGLGLAAAWRSEQAPLAAMLFDRDAIEPALVAALAWLRRERPGVAGVRFPVIAADGALARALGALAGRSGARLEIDNRVARAALGIAGRERFEAALDKKRRKEWSRQARRLAERGQLAIGLAEGGEGIERFFQLEAKGWKGARGTALNGDPARLAFAREMLLGFHDAAGLQVHEMTLDGAPIAMGIVLRAGARAYYWKTAFDEDFAEFSPGVQLTLALSRTLANAFGLAIADSCALQDHPMIDRIWPARLDLLDMTLATGPDQAVRFGVWLALSRGRARAREMAKGWVNRWREWKRS